MATGGGDGKGDDPALIDNSAFVNNVTCAICLETYRRPKILPCFHTFCQSCLQNVAGTATSFPCPACRAIVLLPEGGVTALQNNFYVEQELGTNATAAAARLCDACDDDREAAYSCFQCRQRYCITCRRCHDSISSCRSHTVVPLQLVSTPNLKGNNGSDEEKCLKHKNQPVILHCVACKVSICIQCKLTSHEGHPTEDLADTGNKAKASLQDTLKTLKDQVRKLEGVMEAVKQKGSELHFLQEETEREIRQRADILHKWTDECRDKVLHTLQSLNRKAVSTLAETRSHLQHKHAALTARSEHVTRVLFEDKDTNLVNLNDQLKGATTPVDVDNVNQLLDDIDSISKPYQVDHSAAIVNIAQLQEYVGILSKSAPRKKQAQYTPTSANMHVQSSILFQTQVPTSPTSTVAMNPKPKVSVTFHEMFYSNNPKSVVSSICVTSEKRVWIRYKPSGEGLEMGLFDQKGLLQKVNDVIEWEFHMITCAGDNTLVFRHCNQGSSVNVARCTPIPFSGSWRNGRLCGVSKCAFGNTFYAVRGRDFESHVAAIVYFDVLSVNPVKLQSTDIVNTDTLCLLDISHGQEYIATSEAGFTPVKIFGMPKRRNSVRFCSSYVPERLFNDIKQPVLDACFFTHYGQEVLLVIFEHDFRIHMVDHADGCRLVGYMNTSPCSIVCNPCRLATDNTNVLWIACKGGKVVMLTVN